uniref:Uncharacterized protein n=1 Tax=Glossina austeni TaxID=7395 RepID=A0A1A9VMW6_GLOAU
MYVSHLHDDSHLSDNDLAKKRKSDFSFSVSTSSLYKERLHYFRSDTITIGNLLPHSSGWLPDRQSRGMFRLAIFAIIATASPFAFSIYNFAYVTLLIRHIGAVDGAI